jgi:DNA-binding transcriptional LysR family regulator
MDLVALHIFKTVAEAGGITRAAARLHRVQSNVTTRVQQLEKTLGTTLFHRHKRRLVLSAEGKVLLAYADRLLRLSSEAEAVLRDGSPRGVLCIGSLESTAATRLPPILARFHRAYPDVRLELVTGTTGALVARVRGGDIEAAFVAEPFTPQDLEVQRAFVEELVLITPKGFGAVRGAKDVLHTPILAFANGCSYRRRLEAWLGGAGISPERVMEYGSYHAIVACAAAGSGIAIVPRSVLEALRRGQELDTHPLPREVAQANTMLVWRDGHRSTALDAMRKVLATCGLPAARARSAARSPASRNGARRRGAARRAPRSSAPAASR